MTVEYNYDACSTTWLGLTRLLFRWRGSVWKAIMGELVFWGLVYSTLSLSLTHLLNDTQLANFENFRKKLEEDLRDYPMIFMLGFFVSVVFTRWVAIFQYIGFVDNLALTISTAIKGSDIESRIIKRNIIRYAVLSQALVFRDISIQCRLRFPDIEALVDSGLMTSKERELYEACNLDLTKFWIPISWALNLLVVARDEEKISSDLIFWNTQEKVRNFRNDLQKLACYDWIPVPIAYPQIIYIAVRLYFCFITITSQITSHPSNSIFFYIPWVALIKFLLIAGWVKVAESLINPFGIDDDDYECNFIIDRNLKIGFAIVETTGMPLSNELDAFWGLKTPQPLDTLDNTSKFKKETPYSGSVADIEIPRTTNDEDYRTKLIHRRNMLRANNSAMSTNLSLSQNSISTFVDHKRFSSPRSHLTILKPDNLQAYHHLDDVNEMDDTTSANES